MMAFWLNCPTFRERYRDEREHLFALFRALFAVFFIPTRLLFAIRAAVGFRALHEFEERCLLCRHRLTRDL